MLFLILYFSYIGLSGFLFVKLAMSSDGSQGALLGLVLLFCWFLSVIYMFFFLGHLSGISSNGDIDERIELGHKEGMENLKAQSIVWGICIVFGLVWVALTSL